MCLHTMIRVGADVYDGCADAYNDLSRRGCYDNLADAYNNTCRRGGLR